MRLLLQPRFQRQFWLRASTVYRNREGTAPETCVRRVGVLFWFFFWYFFGLGAPGGKKARQEATARKDRKEGRKEGGKEGSKEGGQEGRKEGGRAGRKEGRDGIFVHICAGNTGSNGTFC